MTSRNTEKPPLSRVCRDVALAVRNSPAVVRGLEAFHRVGGTILRYHSVSDDESWAGDYMQKSLVVTPEIFARQVAFLTRRHRVVSVGEMAEQMRSGRGVDSRNVAITFDDGYEDNYRNAFPILREHGATAAFYVTTGYVGDAEILWTVALRRAIRSCSQSSVSLSFLDERTVDLSTDEKKETTIKTVTGIVKRCKPDEVGSILSEVRDEVGTPADLCPRRIMMNWDEMREMQQAGMTIGAHTLSHYNMPSLDTSDVAQEVVASRRDLEEALQVPIEHFAYPNGRTGRHCDARVAKLVAVAGFKSAVTSLFGPVSHRYSEYCIPRLGVAPRHGDVARLAADMQYSRFRHQDERVVDEITKVLPPRGSRLESGSSSPTNSE